jgi:hypothetical protein
MHAPDSRELNMHGHRVRKTLAVQLPRPEPRGRLPVLMGPSV